jgi:hypothetical protein
MDHCKELSQYPPTLMSLPLYYDLILLEILRLHFIVRSDKAPDVLDIAALFCTVDIAYHELRKYVRGGAY